MNAGAERPTVRVTFPDGQVMEATGTLDQVLAIQAGWFNPEAPRTDAVATVRAEPPAALASATPVLASAAGEGALVQATDDRGGGRPLARPLDWGDAEDAELTRLWAERPAVSYAATKLRRGWSTVKAQVDRLGLA